MAIQDRITAYWDTRGGNTYDAQPGHHFPDPDEHAAWLAALASALPPAPAAILEVGAGTGFLTELLCELGHRVVATDLADGMLSVLREKAAGWPNPPDIRTTDAVAPEVAAGSFDVVASRFLLWTLRDPATAFANWRRALRPGGRTLAIDGFWWRAGMLDVRADDPGAGDAARAWSRLYTDETLDALPLAKIDGVDDLVRVATEAGLANTRVLAWGDVDRFQRAKYTEAERERLGPMIVLVADAPV